MSRACCWRKTMGVVIVVVLAGGRASWAADCNGNGTEDTADIAGGTSADCNTNGVPDECEVEGDLDFASAEGLKVTDWLYWAALGDLDGDGVLDLAVVHQEWDGERHGILLVLLGRGDGSFIPQASYEVGEWARAVLARDLNGDGYLDLAVVRNGGPPPPDRTSRIVVLLNQRDGTFSLAGEFNVGTDATAFSMAAADLDGDGDLDLVMPNNGEDTVTVLPNNGDGSFAAGAVYAAGRFPRSVAVGDFDGDGHVDLAVSNFIADTISLLRNRGDGTFADPVTVARIFYGTDVAAGDLDGDGDLDLAVGDGSILLNNGDATFTPAESVDARGHIIRLADLDGDGDLELVATSSHSVTVLHNRGDASFLRENAYTFSSQLGFSLAVGDVDGDGDADLVGVMRRGAIGVLRNHGDGTFDGAASYAAGGASLVTGDVDGDGDLDVVVGTQGCPGCRRRRLGYGSVLLNLGDGTLADPVEFARGEITPAAIALGDLDGDGDLDLAVVNAYYDPTVSVLRYDPNFGFVRTGDFPIEGRPIFRGRSSAITAKDLDGDGDLDLAVTNGESDTLSVLLNHGDGTFALPTSYVVGVSPTAVAAGDFDGDGALDLAVANEGRSPEYLGSVSVLLNHGDGAFLAAPELATGKAVHDVAAADVDADGDLDLVVALVQDASVSVWLNDGAARFAWAGDHHVGTAPFSLAVGDLDGNGAIDLAVAGYDGLNTSLLLNRGRGRFAVVAELVAGDGRTSVTAADMDGDGDLDLVTAGRFVSVLLNESRAALGSDRDGNGVPDDCTPGDGDGDGDVDLADYLAFEACFRGADVALHLPRCATFDFDRDADVDLADFLAFQALFHRSR